MAKRRRKTKVLSADEKKRRIESWAQRVGLNGPEIADALIAKYGIDQAYKLAQDAMMKPVELAKKYGISVRSSRGVLEYMAGDAANIQPARESAGNSRTTTSQAAPTVSAPVNTTPRPRKKVQNAQVEENRQLRYQYIDKKFPKLDRREFASDAEYMRAARQQYREMKAYRWELTCSQEALDMYNSSENPAVNPNRDIWRGRYPRNENYCASDSTYCQQGPDLGLNSGTHASCAGTATRVNIGICERFGYTGRDAFFQNYDNCRSARDMHSNSAARKYRHSGKSLEAMIAAGQVGPGTILSVPSVAPKKDGSNSGYHALTVAEVIRDKNGNITDIVLQANNSTSLVRYPVKGLDAALRRRYDKVPGRGRPFIVTSTHIWAQEKIAAEERAMSDEELLAALDRERELLGEAVERSAGIEDTTCRLNTSYAQTASRTGAELNTMIANVQPIEGRHIMTAEAEVNTEAPRTYIAYTDAERQEIRRALLGIDAETYAELRQAMQADRAVWEKQVETLMAGYFTEEGKGNERHTMKLVSGLLTSFMQTDTNNYDLDSFHNFVENATRTDASFNLAMSDQHQDMVNIYRLRQNGRA